MSDFGQDFYSLCRSFNYRAFCLELLPVDKYMEGDELTKDGDFAMRMHADEANVKFHDLMPENPAKGHAFQREFFDLCVRHKVLSALFARPARQNDDVFGQHVFAVGVSEHNQEELIEPILHNSCLQILQEKIQIRHESEEED